MKMAKYRKKPLEIEAVQFTPWNIDMLKLFAGSVLQIEADGNVYVDTLEGRMLCSENDFVIKGIAGEFYPCKPDIFLKSYELVRE
jgi:hypothetical protein